MALNSFFFCAAVPFRNYSLTHVLQTIFIQKYIHLYSPYNMVA